MSSLAQEYLLLLLDDESGRPLVADSYMKYGVAGAVLADLALAGRIEVVGRGGLLKPGTVQVIGRETVGDPVADTTLRELAADKPRAPYALLTKLSYDIRPRVLDQLVDAGIVRRENGRVLGVFPRQYWPANSTQMEQEVRAGLRRVLVDGVPPTAEQSALVALLNVTTGLAHALPGEDKRLIKRRAKQVAAADWAPQAAKSLVNAVVEDITKIISAAMAAAT